MVAPLGSPATSDAPPPAELTKFKPFLLAVGVGYGVDIVVGLVGGYMTNSLSYLFIVSIALFMALRARECLGQCVVPLTLFAAIVLLFDVVTMVLVLSMKYPSAKSFFAASCPMLDSNDTMGDPVSDTPNMAYSVVINETTLWLKSDARVDAELDWCSWQRVVANLSILGGLLLDFATLILGLRMWSTARLIIPLLGGDPGSPLSGNLELSVFGSSTAGDARGPASTQRFAPFQGQAQLLDG